MFLFEPTYRHKSRYAHCDTYEGFVTTDNQMTRSSSSNIIMTNNSTRHTMIHAHETIGMLKSVDNTQVCTIHKIVTLHDPPLDDKNLSSSPKEKLDSLKKGKGDLDPSIKSKCSPKPVKNVFDQITKKANTKPKLVKKEFYHIPIRNNQTGKIEVNTLFKEETSLVIDINEIGPQEDLVSYKKLELSDAPIDRKTTLELEKLLEQYSDAFAKGCNSDRHSSID